MNCSRLRNTSFKHSLREVVNCSIFDVRSCLRFSCHTRACDSKDRAAIYKSNSSSSFLLLFGIPLLFRLIVAVVHAEGFQRKGAACGPEILSFHFLWFCSTFPALMHLRDSSQIATSPFVVLPFGSAGWIISDFQLPSSHFPSIDYLSANWTARRIIFLYIYTWKSNYLLLSFYYLCLTSSQFVFKWQLDDIITVSTKVPVHLWNVCSVLWLIWNCELWKPIFCIGHISRANHQLALQCRPVLLLLLFLGNQSFYFLVQLTNLCSMLLSLKTLSKHFNCTRL